MTDEEIIKAFECCNDNYSCPTDCPLYEDDRDCLLALNKPVLDLINRQKAEIERLKSPCEMQIEVSKKLENTIKAEAVKEFAERLKDLKHECGCNYRKKPVFAVTEDKIDNLVKEMVGEG